MIKRAMHFCKCNGVVYQNVPRACYHAKLGRSALKGIDMIQENPKKWGALKLRSLIGCEAWLCTPLHDLCFHVKFVSSVTKGVRKNRRNAQNWGSLLTCNSGAAYRIKITLSPYVLPFQIGRSSLKGGHTREPQPTASELILKWA